MLKAITELLHAFQAIISGPNNDPVVVGLFIAVFALLYANVSNYFSFRARLKEKDARIEDLVAERNKFQDIVLRNRGLQRKSSKR